MRSKLLLLLLSFFFFFQSCKKDIITNSDEVAKPAIGFVEQAHTFLKVNYTAGSINDLLVNKSSLYKLDSGRYVIKVPLKTQGLKNFILLYADSIYGVKKGVLVHIDKTSNTLKGEKFTGTITIKEINGKVKEIKKIVDGFKVKKATYRTTTDGYQDLPEVVVIAYRTIDKVNWGEWFNLMFFFGGNLNNKDSYGYMENEGGPGGGGGGGEYQPDPNVIEINFDDALTTEPIDLLKYLNCFNQIQNLGATYSIKICAQLPVDNNPVQIIDGLATGHAFLTVTKTNGMSSMTQNFGFYPANGPKSMALLPVPSKVGDNDFTKYNASLTASNVSYDQFSTFMQTAMTLSTHSYDLNNYNCANFALDCFNSIKSTGDKLVVPNTIRDGINYRTTPNGIYELLRDKKNNGDPEASNINMGVNHSSFSNGPCN